MNVPDKIVIECPQCSNRYEIEVAAISEEGTNLKCASCEHEWAVKKVVEQATPTNTETEKKPKTEENTKPKTPSIPFQRKKPDESKLKKPEFKSVSLSGCTVFFVLIPILSFLFGTTNSCGEWWSILYMGVSENSGFSPQIIHFDRVFHYKPSILGYPYFWKHLYVYIYTYQHTFQSGCLP